MEKYFLYKNLDLVQIASNVLADWKKDKTFQRSLKKRKKQPVVHFYEGPPGANGLPGLHHLFSRTLKDLFCRYKTMQGYFVPRKSGWDTHGLPVELAVEKELGIKKEDIGQTISITAYNTLCKKAVMRYQKEWETITEQIGFWLDLEKPYVTCKASYINVLWGILEKLYKKGYLYAGYSIQPYSPAAGTGLSTHELNQPGAYKEVRETTIVVQFSMNRVPNTYLLAWTTTPWTLPANTALAVQPKIQYVKIKTFNRYTAKPIYVILAEEAMPRFFKKEQENAPMIPPKAPDEALPWKKIGQGIGADLKGYTYTPVLPYIPPKKPAFRVVTADFVSAKEGTGIVHIAPTFGEDDYRVAQAEGLPSIVVTGQDGTEEPIVDKQGRFISQITDFAGAYVKKEYDPNASKETKSVDTKIAIKLKQENKAFLVQNHKHNYPHCWRTGKPILFYPLKAWFIKTTACKERLIALNKTIQWHPAATGSGRFGEWLNNIVDWNISRDRFWGTPLNIWRTKDGKEEKVVKSVQELREEIKKSIKAGYMEKNLPAVFDPHRPNIDKIILVSEQGQKMYRETEVVDVWFDSGAMPYAQHGKNKDLSSPPSAFPADFIIEGVDQTRGWFYTLHTLAVLLYDRIAFKRVLSTGLLLDKEGRKMSKRLGNVIDPTEMLTKYGADVLRWYMIVNTNPWENLKFDEQGLEEVKRKFFGTLFNTYQFFALYANIDQFQKQDIPVLSCADVSDRWILSKLNQLILDTKKAYEDFAPTQAARAMQTFVIDELSNWYVRLNRKRFWQGTEENKRAAFQTLHHCLVTVAQLAAPIAPFYMDQLYNDLLDKHDKASVHLTNFPVAQTKDINNKLEQAMAYAQTVSSLVHSLRRKNAIKVRQPLSKILLPINANHPKENIEQVESLILAEVNVKSIEWVQGNLVTIKKRIRPNFYRLREKYTTSLKAIGEALEQLTEQEIQVFEKQKNCFLTLNDQQISIALEDVFIIAENISGWATAQNDTITVALDLRQTPELRAEGMARELINKIQNLRKKSGLKINDKINLTLATDDAPLLFSLKKHEEHIKKEVHAEINWEESKPLIGHSEEIKLDNGIVYVVIKADEC